MKGFIYIEQDNGTKYLINIQHIAYLKGVSTCKIVLDTTKDGAPSILNTKLTPEEVIAMIEKAQ